MKRAARDEAALPAAEHRTSNIEHPTSNGGERAYGEGAGRFDLEERLLEYSARIIRLADALVDTRAGTHVGGQLLCSGTAPLPNHGEAQAAESLNDFIHKLKICLKELRETYRWLQLVKRVPLVAKPAKVDPLIDETDQLIRIFVASLRKANERPKDGKVREDERFSPSMFDVGSWMFDVQQCQSGPDPAGPPHSVGASYLPKPRPTRRRK